MRIKLYFDNEVEKFDMNNGFYKSEYGDIFYEFSVTDEKPLIIFTHGVGMDHKTFEMQAKALKSDYSLWRRGLWNKFKAIFSQHQCGTCFK